MKPAFAEGSSGIEVVKIADRAVLQAAQWIIDSHFPKSTEFYSQMPLEQYRSIVVDAQTALKQRCRGPAVLLHQPNRFGEELVLLAF